jgi:hypothetical protein
VIVGAPVFAAILKVPPLTLRLPVIDEVAALVDMLKVPVLLTVTLPFIEAVPELTAILNVPPVTLTPPVAASVLLMLLFVI